MLVRVLTTKFGDATGMVWVEVELEPLVAEAIVVNLKSPFDLLLLVAKLPRIG